MMTGRIVILEVEGGSDKWFDGHRKDTMPIADALRDRDCEVEVLYYRDEWKATLLEYVNGRFDAYISRVNPGQLESEGEYFDFLRSLSAGGMVGFSHPDQMVSYGAKDVLVKLAHTPLVPDDTYAYYDYDELAEQLPLSLSHGERVLKQNRGSTGEGIWRVRVIDERPVTAGTRLTGDMRLACTEAVDNHTQEMTVDELVELCRAYVIGENAMLVDMKFLPRIKEGELRVLYVGQTPIFVVHKKPADTADAFSATLFSGAQYTYYSPEEYAVLITHFEQQLPTIQESLGNFPLPLLWTADFILDTDEDGQDRYILGEMNCSCVGFTTHLDQGIQAQVADEVLKSLGITKES